MSWPLTRRGSGVAGQREPPEAAASPPDGVGAREMAPDEDLEPGAGAPSGLLGELQDDPDAWPVRSARPTLSLARRAARALRQTWDVRPTKSRGSPCDPARGVDCQRKALEDSAALLRQYNREDG